jgi:hypothetical protein
LTLAILPSCIGRQSILSAPQTRQSFTFLPAGGWLKKEDQNVRALSDNNFNQSVQLSISNAGNTPATVSNLMAALGL